MTRCTRSARPAGTVRRPRPLVLLLATAVVAVAAGLTPTLTVVAAPQGAISAVKSVKADQSLPTDILDDPSERLISADHELLISRVDGSPTANTSSQTWATTDPLVSSLQPDVAPKSAPVQAGRSLTGPYPTASGRFLDSKTDRVLAFQRAQAGTSSIYQLLSTNAGAETNNSAWNKVGPTVNDSITDGLTVQIQSENDTPVITNTAAAGSLAVGSQVSAEAAASVSSMNQQWVFAAVGDQWLIISRADGTCLATDASNHAIGDPIGTAICDSDDPTQLWQTNYSAPWNGVAMTNLQAGADVGYDDDGGLQLVGAQQESTNAWTFAPILEPGTVMPSWAAPNALTSASAPFDLAAGDLDSEVGDDDQYHDEAAVAYLDVDQNLQVRVIDYNANATHLLAVRAVMDPIAVGNGTGLLGPLTVDIADFNGDGTNEVGVTWPGSNGVTNISFFGYTAGPTVGVRTLTFLKTVSLGIQPLWSVDQEWNTFVYSDSASWDFDGKGGADLVFGYPALDPGFQGAPKISYAFFNADLTLNRTYSKRLGSGGGPASSSVGQHGVIQLGTGAFVAATANDPSVRQLAVAWPNYGGVADAEFLDYLPPGTAGGESVTDLHNVVLPATGFSQWGISMATGAFGLAQAGALPVWGIAVASLEYAQDDSPSMVDINLIQPQATGVPTVNQWQEILDEHEEQALYTLTAYDRSGDALILGPPVTMTVEQLKQPTLVAAQPPSHSDWLAGGFQNVSRSPGLSVAMGETTTSSFSNTTSHQSDQTYAVSQNFDIKTTLSEGVPFIEKGEASLDVSEKFQYTWNQKSSTLNSFSSQNTATVTQATGDDDIVNAEIQSFRIIRYPVLGAPTTGDVAQGSECDNGCAGYWEVTIPGAVTPMLAGGKELDFYQPSWQNGNVLSYPVEDDNNQVPITDQGSYTYQDVNNNTQTAATPLMRKNFLLGGTNGTVGLDVTNSDGSATDDSSSKSWDVGVDVTANVKADVGFGPVAKGSVDTTLGAGFNASKAFTNSTTATTDNSHNSSFLLTYPTVPANQGYGAASTYYFSSGGYPKVAFATNPTANAEAVGWWQKYYLKPDPALNEPDATVEGHWDGFDMPSISWNPLADRQEIRGMVARQPTNTSSPTTSGAPYASAPQDGDPVVFDVPVHNYSLTALTSQVTVDYYAVPVDANGVDLVPGDTIHIGTTSVGPIPPQGVVTASSPQWTAVAGSDDDWQNYRIVVILDRGNSIDEVHEWAGDATGSDVCPTSSVQDGSTLIDPMTGAAETLTCGQNNQGFILLNVAPATPPSSTAPDPKAGVQLDGAGLVTDDPSDRKLDKSSAIPKVALDRPITGLVHAKTNRDSADHQTVLVYDGDPSDGNLIAATTMRGVDDDKGGHAQFTWRPLTKGLHELHQVILGTSRAGDRDEQILRVWVESRPQPFSVTASTDKTSVEAGGQVIISGSVTPTLSTADDRDVALQVKKGDAWTTVLEKDTAADGSYAFTVPQPTAGTYVYRVKKYAAGRRSTAYSPEITITVLKGFVVIAKASPAAIDLGQTTKIVGTVTPTQSSPTDRKVQLQSRSGSTWTKVADGVTSANGSYAFTVEPRSEGSIAYRVLKPATSTLKAAASPPVTVKVTRQFVVTATAKPTTIKRTKKSTIAGTVTPPMASSADRWVQLQQKKGSTWKTVKATKTSSSGRYSFTVKLSKTATYTYRVLKTPAAGKRAAYSPSVKITVRRR